MRAGGQRGFTLMEVLVAVALLSVTALAVTTTLVSAQQARARSERWMQAMQLAAEGMEQLRAGAAAVAAAPPGYERTTTVTAWNGHVGLYALEVTVTWNHWGAQQLQLTTLARR